MLGMLVVLFISVVAAFSMDVGDKCITPNGQIATCVPIFSCDHILKTLLSLDPEAEQFAKDSQCPNNNETLICCGNATSLNVRLDYPISDLLPNRSVCGLGRHEDRIHGGTISGIEEYPWMALLGYISDHSANVSFKCGGTVINHRYVLTAAHCIRINPAIGISLHLVRLGEWNITSANDCYESMFECADPVIDLLIEEQIPHPKYSIRTGENDIGLLRLEKNFEYSTYIQPVCLPFNKRYQSGVNSTLIVSGWGATETGTYSSVKLKVAVSIVANEDCKKKLGRRGTITKNQLCAGGEKGKDACQGDSGGPLMRSWMTSYSHQWFQEGIVSWGNKCGVLGYPGIYTRVSEYLVWILENMHEF